MRNGLLKIVIGSVGLLGGLGLVGCSTAHEKSPEQKQLAQAQWNDARSDVLLGLANEQYKDGNLDKCRQTVEEALKMQPNSAPLHVLSAKLDIEQGQMDAADNELKTAREIDHTCAEAYYLSGVVYQRWEKPEVAYDYYTHASELAPNELAYLLARSEMLVAMNRTGEALVMLQDKVTFYEHSAAIRDAVGQLLMQMNRYEDAVAILREAAILGSDEPAIKEHLALAEFCNKNYADAEQLLARLTSEDGGKRVDLLLELAQCQVQLAETRQAVQTFSTITDLDSSCTQAWLGLGQCAIGCGDFRRAEMSARRVLASDADNASAHLLLGYACYSSDQMDEAVKQFDLCTKLTPTDPTPWCMEGLAYCKQGRVVDAARCCDKARQIDASDPMVDKLSAQLDLN